MQPSRRGVRRRSVIWASWASLSCQEFFLYRSLVITQSGWVVTLLTLTARNSSVSSHVCCSGWRTVQCSAQHCHCTVISSFINNQKVPSLCSMSRIYCWRPAGTCCVAVSHLYGPRRVKSNWLDLLCSKTHHRNKFAGAVPAPASLIGWANTRDSNPSLLLASWPSPHLGAGRGSNLAGQSC